MAESIKSQRVGFPKSRQKRFLQNAKRKLSISWRDLAKILSISERTLTDWKREKFTIPFETAKFLAQKSKIHLPSTALVKERFWYVKRASRAGGLAVYKKYGSVGGNPETRKEKWRKWWKIKGRFVPRPFLKIRQPKFSAELAELTGILMGDGGISKYQVVVTLHNKDDKAYSRFVIKMIKKLFGVAPRVYEDRANSVNDLVVSRKAMVNFCVSGLGLKLGNKIKQKIDIPQWIIKRKNFQIACVRGLIDTDGSVFTHAYKVHGKLYQYKKLSFTSRSQPLLISVQKILRNLNMNPRLSPDTDVRLESIKDVATYFKKVGSHNPKHLKRYSK